MRPRRVDVDRMRRYQERTRTAYFWRRNEVVPTKPRLRACVERWPDCYEGGYDPSCCRFPKTCSADVYDPERVGPEDLEEVAGDV